MTDLIKLMRDAVENESAQIFADKVLVVPAIHYDDQAMLQKYKNYFPGVKLIRSEKLK